MNEWMVAWRHIGTQRHIDRKDISDTLGIFGKRKVWSIKNLDMISFSKTLPTIPRSQVGLSHELVVQIECERNQIWSSRHFRVKSIHRSILKTTMNNFSLRLVYSLNPKRTLNNLSTCVDWTLVNHIVISIMSYLRNNWYVSPQGMQWRIFYVYTINEYLSRRFSKTKKCCKQWALASTCPSNYTNLK